ncbi:MAG: hypothetical protein DRJ01_00370 [Bacteroidetes bacterium]|nr:MAG: hypothetical protein DRJ01_00370 [Bacteroidota bacterium]
MTLNEFVNKTTQTGKLVRFSKGHGKNGLVVVAKDGEGKRYVLEKSLKDYSRFEDWIGMQSRTDVRQTGKFHKTEEYGILPLIQIRVKVDSEDQDIDDKNKEMVF